MRSQAVAGGVLLLSTALVLVGCSPDDEGDRADSTTAGDTTITVFAAASLKQAFTAIAEQFSEANPDIDVKFGFDGSQALVTQIRQGARADVIATADAKSMAKLGAEVIDPKTFATNVLTIVTRPGNPQNIRGLADLTKDGVSTVICALDVPCGSSTAQIERRTGITLEPVSEETSVTGVLTKVQTGQADAGLVYVTDATGAGDSVTSVSDPAFAEVVNSYPIGVLAAAKNRSAAQKFVDMVLGRPGAVLLASMGFGPAR